MQREYASALRTIALAFIEAFRDGASRGEFQREMGGATERWISVKEAAHVLNMSERTVYRRASAIGERDGDRGRWRLPESKIEELVKKGRVKREARDDLSFVAAQADQKTGMEK